METETYDLRLQFHDGSLIIHYKTKGIKLYEGLFYKSAIVIEDHEHLFYLGEEKSESLLLMAYADNELMTTLLERIFSGHLTFTRQDNLNVLTKFTCTDHISGIEFTISPHSDQTNFALTSDEVSVIHHIARTKWEREELKKREAKRTQMAERREKLLQRLRGES